MSDDQKELEGYYVLDFERFLQVHKQIEAGYYVLCDMLSEYVPQNEPESWEKTPIPELTDCFKVVNDLRVFLDHIINDPTDEEIALSVKYNITDVLISLENLQLMDNMFIRLEEKVYNLYENHRIVLTIQ